MAGGVLKAFGGIFLVLGCVLVLAGVGAAALGYKQETDNRDKGPFYDGQEGEVNEQMITYGLYGAGAGLVAGLLGAILLAAGGARGRRSLERAVAQSGRASPAASASAPVPLPAVPEAAATHAAPKRQAVAAAPKPAPRKVPARPVVPPVEAKPGNGKGAVVAVVAVLVLLAVVAVVVTGGFGSFAGFADSRSRDAEPPILAQSFNGTVGPSLAGYEAEAAEGSFTLQAAAARCDLVLDWTPEATGAGALRLELHRPGGEPAAAHGEPGLMLRADGLPAGTYGWRVAADGDGAFVLQQAFTLRVTCAAA